MTKIERKVDISFNKLLKWLKENGYKGYDPYGFIGQEWIKSIFGTKNNLRGKFRKALKIISDRYPYLFIKIFNVKPKINAKSMGLLALGYFNLFEKTNDEKYLIDGEKILTWLSSNYNQNYSGMSWGYPFHWYSRIFIPISTPSSVVTGVISDAYFKHYQLTKSVTSLNVIKKINAFFLSELKHFRIDDNNICFSYTPIDNFRVHNASLFTAVFFAKFYKITGEMNSKKLSIDAARFTLNEQNADGSFCYWSNEKDSVIDHFHTGYNLRHLHTIARITKSDWIIPKINLGYEYFINNLFDTNNLPVYTNKLSYPKDTHAFAETILTLDQLSDIKFSIDNKKKIEHIFNTCVEFCIDEMQTKSGYFIWQINKNNKKIDVPFIRWCQSWMFLAFTKILKL